MNRRIKKRQVVSKNSTEAEFFEINQRQSSPACGLHVLAVVICIIFAVWVWMLNPIPQIHGDQINITTMILAKKYPDNFARDLIYAGKGADYYPALARWIIGFFIERFGVIGGYRAAQLPLSIAYLLVTYGVLYYLARSVPAALLTATASIIWRWSMGQTYWGLDRLQAVQPRSFAIIFVPVLFLLFWKFRDSWRMLIPFFLTGLLFNLNPPSSLSFVILIWLSLFLVGMNNGTPNTKKCAWEPNRGRIKRLLAAPAVFIGGALPYLCINLAIRKNCAINLTGQALQEHISALQYQFSQTGRFLFPASYLAKTFMAGFSVLVLLAAVAWCMRKENRNIFDRWLVCFFLLAFVGTVTVQWLIQLIYAHFKITLDYFCLIRGNKFAYLVLYIYIAWLMAQLLRRFGTTERRVLIIAAAVIVALMPLFKNNAANPWGQWRYNRMQADALFRGEKIEIAGWHLHIANVSAWARQNTPKDSLFLFVSRFMDPFRIYALRSVIVCSHLCGGDAMFNGQTTFATWARYQQDLEWIIARKDVSRLLKLADESAADYIITPNEFPRVNEWPIAMRDQFWTVYKRPIG